MVQCSCVQSVVLTGGEEVESEVCSSQIVQCAMCAVCSIVVYTAQCAMNSAQCTVCSIHSVQSVVLTGGGEVKSKVCNSCTARTGYCLRIVKYYSVHCTVSRVLCWLVVEKWRALCAIVNSLIYSYSMYYVCTTSNRALCAECCVDWWWRSGDLLTNFIIAPLPLSPQALNFFLKNFTFCFLRKKITFLIKFGRILWFSELSLHIFYSQSDRKYFKNLPYFWCLNLIWAGRARWI